MHARLQVRRSAPALLLILWLSVATQALADEAIKGQVLGAPEAVSTRCGGQGVSVFFGMAKPVRAPQIGPAQPY